MDVMKIQNGFRGSYNLFITPGEKVEIHTHLADGSLVNVRVFRPGDVAEYDSFNLSYTAPIVAITTKNVIFDLSNARHVARQTCRLKMVNFAWRNHNFDAVAARERNAAMSNWL